MRPAQLRQAVQLELDALEAQAHEQVRAKGWRFAGADRVLAASPYGLASRACGSHIAPSGTKLGDDWLRLRSQERCDFCQPRIDVWS